MSNALFGRVFLLSAAFVLFSAVVAHAAGTGAEIVEFTGGATQIFEAMRAENFVRWTCVALFGILLIAGFGGYISGGWTAVMGGLLMLAGWMGAEPIVDTIFASGVVI